MSGSFFYYVAHICLVYARLKVLNTVHGRIVLQIIVATVICHLLYVGKDTNRVRCSVGRIKTYFSFPFAHKFHTNSSTSSLGCCSV